MALLNDYKWFNELYEMKKKLVFKMISNKTNDLDDVDDISQMVWEKVFKYRKKLQNLESREINAYLKEIVNTTAADYYKGIMKHDKTIKEYGKVIEFNGAAYDAEMSYKELRDNALHRAMDMLTSEEKNLIYFIYYQKHKSSEVAEMFGISASLVRMRLTMIRRRMRNEIESIIAEENANV